MMDCISVENMRRSDALTIENYVPSLTLMGRAARGVLLAARKHFPEGWQGRVAILAGSGNNGGDGFALACLLAETDCECVVYTLSDKRSADSAHYAEKAASLGISILPFQPEKHSLKGFDYVVDCLLGTGFQGSLRENYRCAIDAVNKSGARVISVDINSGMNGDTGEGEQIVFSDLTVTIGFVKTGLVTDNAGNYMKHLVCADIGIVLAMEEGKITRSNCPHWLDMEVIHAVS